MKAKPVDGLRHGMVSLSREYGPLDDQRPCILHLPVVPGVPAGVYLPIDARNRHALPVDVFLIDRQLFTALQLPSTSADGDGHSNEVVDAQVLDDYTNNNNNNSSSIGGSGGGILSAEILMLHCEPLTAQDWQIISDNAGWVEESMLEQVQYASVGQTIVLWVRRTAVVRLRVTGITLTSDGSNRDNVNALFGRLSSMSEVSIAPYVCQYNSVQGGRKAAQLHAENAWIGCYYTPSSIQRDYLAQAPPQVISSVTDKSTIGQAGLEWLIVCIKPHFQYRALLPCSADIHLPPGAMFAAMLASNIPSGCSDSCNTKMMSPCISDSLHFPGTGAFYSVRSVAVGGNNAIDMTKSNIKWTVHPVIDSGSVSPPQLPGRIDWVAEFRQSMLQAIAKSQNQRRMPVVLTDGMLWPLFCGYVCLHFEKADSQNVNEPNFIVLSDTDKTTDLLRLNINLGKPLVYLMRLSSDPGLCQPPTDYPQGDDRFGLQAKRLIDYALHTGQQQRLLLLGSSGTGKTYQMQKLKQHLHNSKLFVQMLPCDWLSRKIMKRQELMLFLTGCLERALLNAPSVILLDDADHLEMSVAEWHELSEIIATMDQPLVIIISADSPQKAPLIFDQGGFIHLHHLPNAPDRSTRERIWREMLTSTPVSTTENDSIDYALLASLTDGYSPADIRRLIDKSAASSVMQHSPQQSLSTKAVVDVIEADKMMLSGSRLNDNCLGWKDIGGMESVKMALQEALLWPTRYQAIFRQTKALKSRGGLLLYGPPGCGKTTIAQSLATEFGLKLITVKGPELFNKYIGASEQAVRERFEQAAACKPCVLFFDEFDSVAPRRGSDETGVTDRVVNQLLTQLDGAEQLADGVFIVAATSRPHLIDPALLRPGRLSRRIYCGMPNQSERAEILSIYARRAGIKQSPEIDWPHNFAGRTEGWTGGDLKAFITSIYLEALHEYLATAAVECKNEGVASEFRNQPVTIIQSHIDEAFANFRPCLPAHEWTELQRIYRQFQNNDDSFISDKEIGKKSTLHN